MYIQSDRKHLYNSPSLQRHVCSTWNEQMGIITRPKYVIKNSIFKIIFHQFNQFSQVWKISVPLLGPSDLLSQPGPTIYQQELSFCSVAPNQAELRRTSSRSFGHYSWLHQTSTPARSAENSAYKTRKEETQVALCLVCSQPSVSLYIHAVHRIILYLVSISRCFCLTSFFSDDYLFSCQRILLSYYLIFVFKLVIFCQWCSSGNFN